MKLKHLALILLTASCSTTIKNFDQYQKQFLTKTEFMPTKENLENKPPKIVVFAFDENENQIATQTQLGNSIANNVENILAQNRLAELVDRKAGAKLQKEIALAEMNKTGSYKGPKIAEYAISGSISNAAFNSKYSSGSTFINPKNGQVISIPPKYTYSSDVAGNLKIYELPSLTVVQAIEFSGRKTRSENVQQDGGLNLGGLQIGGKQVKGADRDDGLVRKAGEDAVSNISIDLKNALAKKGYILEKRTLDKKVIFKISLGSNDGLKQDDKFEVTGQYEIENAITNESEVEHRIIGAGSVSNLIDPKSAWVVLDDEKQAEKIRLGDVVKMKYKRGSFDGVLKATKSMIEG
ncbi:MAG: hypothetical protein KA100_02400 [Rickettsiales bacterium]|nr:hypothetical protein [Rickettsiales bacterium]